MRAILAALAFAVAAAGFAPLAIGQADEVAHPDAKVERRLKELGEQLRCLVCQNETIADSQAPLAEDLRNEIRGMIRAGKSDDQIRAYLVARYGDFVLYKPPFKSITVLLWVGPFALLALGVGVMAVVLKRRRALPAAPPPRSDAQRAQVAQLLEGDPPARKQKR
ncbi:MAG TPA: cytochrome c-type biogenesis protein [Usitatibacter sp.]|nr:cytochrome c-type biogenesis protein [Usitatibacter sp.]